VNSNLKVFFESAMPIPDLSVKTAESGFGLEACSLTEQRSAMPSIIWRADIASIDVSDIKLDKYKLYMREEEMIRLQYFLSG
jgi:hypothetical protein